MGLFQALDMHTVEKEKGGEFQAGIYNFMAVLWLRT